MNEKEYISKVNSIDYLQFLITKPRIETEQKIFIETILEISQRDSSMVGFIEREGSGKSTAIAEYFLRNKYCYYVKVGESYSSKTIFHELIFYLSGEIPNNYTPMVVLVKHLSSLLNQDKQKKKLIIIDDAGKLTHNGLGLFHELRDNTLSCTSYVFVGLPYFRKDLQKWKRAGKEGIGEFYRRIENWYDQIPALRKSEKIEYCKLRGLDSKEDLKEVLTYSSISEIENFVNRRLQLNHLNVDSDSDKDKSTSKFELEIVE